MAYTVRRGKLVFTPRTGNGPCNRRTAGKANRRIIYTRTENGMEYSYHVTKGWRVRTVEHVQ